MTSLGSTINLFPVINSKEDLAGTSPEVIKRAAVPATPPLNRVTVTFCELTFLLEAKILNMTPYVVAGTPLEFV